MLCWCFFLPLNRTGLCRPSKGSERLRTAPSLRAVRWLLSVRALSRTFAPSPCLVFSIPMHATGWFTPKPRSLPDACPSLHTQHHMHQDLTATPSSAPQFLCSAEVKPARQGARGPESAPCLPLTTYYRAIRASAPCTPNGDDNSVDLIGLCEEVMSIQSA